jgi:hypothetical protein
MVIDEFIISLGIDAKKVQSGMKEVTRMVEASTKAWMSIFGSFTIAATAAFAQYTQEAEALGKKSKDIGIGVAALNALELAADRAGGSAEDLERDMKRLADETGGNAYGALLELAQLAEEMGEAEYTTYAEALGISTTTIDLTKGGTRALKDQMHAMKEMGLITAQDAKLAQEFSRNMKDLWQTFRGIMNIVFRSVLPGFNKVLDFFKRVMIDLRKHDTLVKAFFIGLATVITALVLPALAKMAAAILMNPITWLIAMVAALALVIEDLVVWCEGGESALADLWKEIFGSPDDAKEVWETVKQAVIDFFTTINEYLPTATELWKGFVEVIKAISRPILGIVGVIKFLINVFDLAGAAFDKLTNAISAGIDFLYGKFLELAAVIEKALSPLAKKGQSIIGDVQPMDVSQYVDDQGNPVQKADGGIFTSPTHALIGEAGAEAVIPFSPGKRNRGLELLSKIAGNFMPNTETTPKFEMPSISLPKFEMPNIQAAQALPMGGATTNNNINSDTRVTVGTVNISAADGTDAANQFMTGVETRAQMWTAAANVAY